MRSLLPQVTPRYFGSEWSYAQIRGLEARTVVAFGAREHTITCVGADDNAATLHDKLAALGAPLLMKTLAGIAIGTLQPTPQPAEGETYAPKIKKEDGLVDWSQPARQIRHRLRAFTPWPGLFTFLPTDAEPRMLKIWSAAETQPATAGIAAGTVTAADKHGIVVATGEGGLVVRELQIEGARRMTAEEFLRGHRLAAGTKLGRADHPPLL